MNKCIELAKLAQGDTSPNPLVGCVIINDNGEVVSTGYHKKYGENHAEVNAILNALSLFKVLFFLTTNSFLYSNINVLFKQIFQDK